MTTQEFAYLAIGAGGAVLMTMLVFSVLITRLRQSLIYVVDNTLERLTKGVQHYDAVNAVLALTEQFQQNPELVQELQGYTDQVLAAALSYRVDSLGKQLATAMDQLATARSNQGSFGSYGSHRHYDSEVKRLENSVQDVQQQLEAACAAVHELFAVSR